MDVGGNYRSSQQFPLIRLLDEWTHTFDKPISICSALSALDTWSRANIDNQPLLGSVWQDLTAIRGHHCCDEPLPHDSPGGEIKYHGAIRPHLVDYVSYDHTDFFQAPHHIPLCCPATLETNSAVSRYVFREHGIENIF